MRAVRAVRGARGGSRWWRRAVRPPPGSDFGRQWCLCAKLRVRRAFQRAKLCRGVQRVRGGWGASAAVRRCDGDAFAHLFCDGRDVRVRG